MTVRVERDDPRHPTSMVVWEPPGHVYPMSAARPGWPEVQHQLERIHPEPVSKMMSASVNRGCPVTPVRGWTFPGVPGSGPGFLELP